MNAAAAPALLPPLNILQVVSGLGVNGAVIHCELLTRALIARGHRVTVLARPGAWVGERLRQAGVRVVDGDMARWPPGDLRRIAALVQGEGFDVIHTHMTRADNFGIFLKWLTGVGCVATAHAHTVHPHWALADQVIAVSEATRRYHRRFNYVPARRIETIRNFIDFDRFAGVDICAARRRVRTPLGLDEATPLVGTLGHVVARKGQLHLVRALARLRASVPNVRLAVVGNAQPRYLNECQAEATRLGVSDRIFWTGERTADAPEIMAALDVYASSAVVEPFGMVVAEAMAAGRPVVATEVGGVPEFVTPGETGWLVPPKNPAALADALAHVLCLEDAARNAVAARGRAHVQANFTLESQVPRIEAVLTRVSRQHATRRKR